MKPTKETYTELDRAYHFFNARLFAKRLPSCVITMQRKSGSYGYFWGDTWADVPGKTITDEVALNPEHFRSRPLADVLSTLVHEMCHLEQHHFGKSSRGRYHNNEWAQMMEAVGLIPSDTGKAGGKRTGQKMTHYIEKGGAFDCACTALLGQGFTIPWQARTAGDKETRKMKAASKTKYTCPLCALNAWAKPDAHLRCGECDKELEAA